MIRYWKHIEKKPYHRPWLDSNINYSSKELSSPDDSYVSMSFRKKPHVQQSRRLMDKQMQKYFDKADEALLNKQMSDRWRNLKSTFDSYMNLTVNERRRTSIANMRGYQLDKNRKILYSFEDNCAYNIKITDLFNKIEVTGKHHDFTDIEKRNIFDNPYAYTPISPYRITWPSVNVKGTADLSLVKIEQSLADVARATEGFTNTMNATMNNFTSAVNNIVATQQNAAINQNFAQEEVKEEEPGLRSKKYTEQYGLDTTVRYDVDENGNPTGLHPKANSRTRILYRGRSKYNERIDRYGWTDDGNYVWDPNTDPIPPPQPLNVTNTINQGVNNVSLDDASIDKMASAFAARVTPYMNGTINSINQLNSVVSNMSSFDYTVNMNQLYATIVQAAADIRTVASEASENNTKMLRDAVSAVNENNQSALNTSLEYQRQSLLYILDTVDKKLNTANFDQSILNLSDSYQALAKSLIKNEEDWATRIPDITNAQHAYVDRVEEKMKDVVEKVGLNQEALVSRINTQEKESMDNIQEVLLAWAQQETNTLGQILQFNSQLAAQVQDDEIVKQLQDIQNRVDQSLNAYQNGLEAIEDQMSNNTRMLCDSITASDGETRQLINDAATTTNSLLTNGMQGLTNTIQDTQAQNTRMIQDGVNALGNAMTSQSEAAQQMRELQAFLMQQLGSNTQKLLDQQDYTNRLLEYNIASDDALRNKIYQAYQMLCGLPIKSQNLPAIEVEPQRQLITNDPNRTNLLLQDANEIIPAAVASEQIAQSNGEAALSPNVNLNMESIEYIRDQYVFFMDIMTNYITDQGLINLTKELGFNRLFNAYLQRGNNDYLMNLFIRIANHNEIKPEEYQTIRDTVNSLQNTLNVDMNDIIAKTRRRVNDMWNMDSSA